MQGFQAPPAECLAAGQTTHVGHPLSSLSVKWVEPNSWEQAPERREYNFR